MADVRYTEEACRLVEGNDEGNSSDEGDSSSDAEDPDDKIAISAASKISSASEPRHFLNAREQAAASKSTSALAGMFHSAREQGRFLLSSVTAK